MKWEWVDALQRGGPFLFLVVIANNCQPDSFGESAMIGRNERAVVRESLNLKAELLGPVNCH